MSGILYKIYNDGSHYVGTRILKGTKKTNNQLLNDKDLELNSKINMYYNCAKNENIKGRKDYILKMLENDNIKPEKDVIDKIEIKIKNEKRNNYKRKKLFIRKASLNKFNYFITVTNNGTRTEEEFRKQLKKCFSNFNVRRGWKVMGVFEMAPETRKLHFHGLLYVPKNEMVGNFEIKKDYSTKLHKMQKRNENTFFKKFGINDFQNIEELNGCINYILKYITKDEEKIFYSRGIKDYLVKKLESSDIVSSYFDFIEKYVIFDDVIDYDLDIIDVVNNERLNE